MSDRPEEGIPGEVLEGMALSLEAGFGPERSVGVCPPGPDAGEVAPPDLLQNPEGPLTIRLPTDGDAPMGVGNVHAERRGASHRDGLRIDAPHENASCTSIREVSRWIRQEARGGNVVPLSERFSDERGGSIPGIHTLLGCRRTLLGPLPFMWIL